MGISQGHFASALQHFTAFGGKELRAPNSTFDPTYYAINNPDVLNAVSAGTFSSVFAHYQEFGESENRAPSSSFASFDSAGYLAANPDVAAAVTANAFSSALDHFISFGQSEARSGSGITTPTAPTTPVSTTFTLTASQDIVSGTDSADTFNANLAQNATLGGVSNTLASGDTINGGAGSDTLSATLVREFVGDRADDAIDTQPVTTSVETVQIEAREGVSFDSNEVITLDAKNMKDLTYVESLQSDGDLVVENLTTLTASDSSRNTDAITISMDHTDNFNSDGDAADLTVYFDEDYLLAGQTSTSSIELRIVNTLELAENSAPLTGFSTVAFSVAGTTVTTDISSATTYAEVAAAINAALTAANITTVTAAVGAERDAVFTDDVGSFTQGAVAGNYNPVVVTSSTGQALASGPIALASNVTDFDGLNTWANSTTTTTSQTIASNIELHKVGREGEGGNLVVGGKSLDAGEGEGIPVFNVAVQGDAEKPSNLGRIVSTNDDLRTVNISTHSDFTAGATHASLTVRGEGTTSGAAASPFGATVTTVDASAFLGNLTIGNESAMEDVRTFTATGGGNVTVTTDLDDNGVYSYTTGAGTDTMTMNLDGDAVDTAGESFTLTTAGAADTVTMTMEAGVSQETMEGLGNLSINSGSGNDSVNLNAYGNVQIDAGTGNDFVRVNSVGANGNATAGASTFGATSVANETAANTFAAATRGDARVLVNAELTVSFAGFESTVSVATNAAGDFLATQTDINAAIQNAITSDTNGLAKLLSVTSGTHEALTVTSLVGGENDLSIDLFQPQLVTGTPTTGQIQYTGGDNDALVDGLVATGGIAAVNTAAVTTANVITDVNALGVGSINIAGAGTGNVTYNVAADDHHGNANANANAYQDHTDNGGNNDTSGAVNFSTIKVGLGDDVVVLHSNLTASNTLDLNEAFGTVKVVNFHDTDVNTVADAAADVGVHALDFTQLLTDQSSASGSTDSAVTTNVTVNVVGNFGTALTNATAANNDANARSNGINVVGYDETVANSTTFASATMAQVVTALNGDATAGVVTGGLAGATLTAVNSAAGANHVGTTQNHIIMLENNANPGEYKLFHVTSTVNAAGVVQNAGDFTGVTDLGTIDFGASVNFSAAGNTDYEAFKAAYIDFADQATSGQTFTQFVAASAEHTVAATFTNKVGAEIANPVTPTTVTVNGNQVVTNADSFNATLGVNTASSLTTTTNNDAIVIGAVGHTTGTIDGLGGDDVIKAAVAGAYDISGLTVSNVEFVDMENMVTVQTTAAQHNAFTEFLNDGAKAVIIDTAASATAKTEIDSYQIFAAGTLVVNAANLDVNVSETGNAGAAETISLAGTVSGTYALGADANDQITVTGTANISGVNSGAATTAVTLAQSANAVTMTQAQLSGFTSVTGTGGVTLTDTIDSTDLDAVVFADSLTITLADGANEITSANASLATGGKALTIDGASSTGVLTFIGTNEATATVTLNVLGGSAVDLITAGGANTITNITAGAGADNMSGGAGADNFTWTATTAAAMATEVGSTAGTDVDFSIGTVGDDIDTWTTTSDTLRFKADLVTNAAGTETDTLLTINTGGTVSNTARFVEIDDTVTNAGQTGVAITTLNALDTTAVAIGDSFIAAITDNTDTFLYLVEQVSAANTIAAQDVTVIGSINGNDVANGDFVSYT